MAIQDYNTYSGLIHFASYSLSKKACFHPDTKRFFNQKNPSLHLCRNEQDTYWLHHQPPSWSPGRGGIFSSCFFLPYFFIFFFVYLLLHFFFGHSLLLFFSSSSLQRLPTTNPLKPTSCKSEFSHSHTASVSSWAREERKQQKKIVSWSCFNILFVLFCFISSHYRLLLTG